MKQRPATLPHDYPVATPRGRPMLFLWGVIIAIALMAALAVGTLQNPARRGDPGSWSAPLIVLLTGAVSALAFRRRQITLDNSSLRIRSTFYSKTIPLNTLRMDQARVVDLDEHNEFKPAFKTWGYSLPGFKSGYFRMRNGSSTFCLITDTSRVLVLPRRDGKLLLISPEQPRVLLDELKRLADSSSRA